MKRCIAAVAGMVAMLVSHRAAAQAPAIEWSHVLASTSAGYCLGTTGDGGYVEGGVFASFGSVFKLDGSGTSQWNEFLPNDVMTGLTTIYAVRQTADNGYIAAGSDFPPLDTDSIGNHGARDFLVLKLDEDGAIEWIEALGGSGNEEASSIEQTPDGGYIVAGYTGSSDGDVTGSTPWYTEYWVVKLDAFGAISWQHTYGGGNYDKATSVVPTSDGGYIVAGHSGSKDGDVAGTHWGGSDDDMWVVKLDASGAITWQNSYGGSKEEQANAIRQTSDGGYIVAGSTVSSDGEVTGKHGTDHDNQDYWLIKLDGAGTLVWQKCLGGSGPGIGVGSGNDIAYDVRQTADGGYVAAGTVSSGAAENDDITGYHGSAGSDFWVVQLDGAGNIIWQKCLGGSGVEDARAIVQTSDGGYAIAGTEQSVDGDVNDPNGGAGHAWVVKLLGDGSGIGEVAGSGLPILYPDPAGSVVHLANAPVGGELSIIDLAGRTVGRSVIAGTEETIGTDQLGKGTYIIRIADHGNYIDRKLVLDR